MPTLIIANWKMNEGKPTAARFVWSIKSRMKEVPRSRTVVLCPPCTLLPSVSDAIRGSRIRLGAQDVSAEPNGPYTGDVSAELVRAQGVSYVIVGHSERRLLHHETDAVARKKLTQVLAHGMTPILCIGETGEERRRGRTKAVLKRQIAGALRGVPISGKGLIIAYEPVWAISTSKNARPPEYAAIPPMLREIKLFSKNLIPQIRRVRTFSCLYGGSVDAALSRHILGERDVGGLLVGSASLDPHRFVSIITA